MTGQGGSGSEVRQGERRRQVVIRVRRRTAAVGLAGIIAVFVSAATALAFWTTSGSGSATASVIEPSVTAVAGTASGLYPGGPPKTVKVTVSNAGPVPYQVTGLTAGVGASPDTCPASALDVIAPTSLPTVTPSAAATVRVTVSMKTDAPNACQRATFSLPLTVRGTL
jgi:hypothetical protein